MAPDCVSPVGLSAAECSAPESRPPPRWDSLLFIAPTAFPTCSLGCQICPPLRSYLPSPSEVLMPSLTFLSHIPHPYSEILLGDFLVVQ